jgi:hypothetical protein
MAGIDVELLRQLPVRQRLSALAAEHLEHSEPEGMAEGLELLSPLDRDDIARISRGGL